MKDFMGCFVKPELLLNVSGKKICKIDLEADASLLKKKDMFIGPQAQRLLKECRRSNSKATGFLDQVKEAYVATGMYLQKKMPVNNILLKHLSALDPAVRGHGPAMQYTKALPRRQSENKRKLGVGPKRSHPSRRIWYSRSLVERVRVCTVAHILRLVDIVVV